MDFACACCCGLCVNCQMNKELKAREPDTPGLFWILLPIILIPHPRYFSFILVKHGTILYDLIKKAFNSQFNFKMIFSLKIQTIVSSRTKDMKGRPIDKPASYRHVNDTMYVYVHYNTSGVNNVKHFKSHEFTCV